MENGIRIGVISDTHLSCATQDLSALSNDIFAGVNMVIHAGDLTELEVLDAFAGHDVVAVAGNMDSYGVRINLPATRVIEVGGYRIGITHQLSNLLDSTEGAEGLDVVVFGHTHQPESTTKNGILYFNPGAFSSRARSSMGRTVGILTIGEGVGVGGQIIQVSRFL